MAIGLVSVQKTFMGEDWINTYAVSTNNDLTPGFGDDYLAALLAGKETISDGFTTPGDALYAGGNSALFALIGFERLLHFNTVEFTRVYISDGKNNSQSPGNKFAVFDTSFNGLRAIGSEGPAPGSICLQVNRVPASYSSRRGRLFYRLVVARSQVGAGANRLVDFATPAVRTLYESLVRDCLDASFLAEFLSAGPQAQQQALAIPKYVPDNLPGAGQLDGGTPVADLIVRNIVPRQVKRGRKKPKNDVTSG